jgi:hypothetical protein
VKVRKGRTSKWAHSTYGRMVATHEARPLSGPERAVLMALRVRLGGGRPRCTVCGEPIVPAGR